MPAPDDLTPEKGWKDVFLSTLKQTANVAAAARAAKIARPYAYEARKADPAFAAAWAQALGEAVDDLEGAAYRRALKGTERPVFYRGEPCGTVTEHSDTLTIFLLRHHRPEVYGDKSSTEHTGEVKVTIRYAEGRDDNAAEAPPGPGADPRVEGPV